MVTNTFYMNPKKQDLEKAEKRYKDLREGNHNITSKSELQAAVDNAWYKICRIKSAMWEDYCRNWEKANGKG